MAGNARFQLVQERGWRSGLSNLFWREFFDWLSVKSVLVQSGLWFLLTNGLVAMIMITIKSIEGKTGLELATTGIDIYGGFATIALSVGAVITTQDSIVGEKNSGTAAWILSKPVSRTAFVLSKFFGNILGLLLTGIVVQSLIAYLEIGILSGGVWLSFGRFLGAVAMIILHVLFYMTLTLMLGTFFNKRGAVIGIPLGLIFGYQMLMAAVPQLAKITPFTIPTQVRFFVVTGDLDIMPLIFTALWAAVFLVVGTIRFQAEDL